MRWIIALGGACGILCVGANVQAQSLPPQPVPSSFAVAAGPRCCPSPAPLPDCPLPTTPGTPGTPGQPGTSPTNPPGMTGQQPGQPGALGDAFAQAPEAGTQPAASYSPGMFGDLGATGRLGQFFVIPPNSPPGVRSGIALVAPVAARASFKIAEDESPRPVDRIFIDYNYYNQVDHDFLNPGRADLHREMFGFEKMFLDGNASFGMRIPFLQLVGTDNLTDSHIDDISMVFKYAFINNRETGNVVSGGLVLTVPTGESIKLPGQTDLHSTVFQPWLGFIYNLNPKIYFQGFTSIAAPSDARDVTIFFNSLGAGYRYTWSTDSDAMLREIVPVLEMHLNTPLNHRGLNTLPLGYPDALDITTGLHFVFKRATAGIAICSPVTGPRSYEFEALANLTYHF
jgi:hypothetical protein